MTKNSYTKQILEDLQKLDSTLVEHELELRTLLTIFEKTKPFIELNEAFIQSLRSKLVPRSEETLTKAHRSPYWWVVHLAPLGAIAILILTLTPQLMNEKTIEITPEAPNVQNSTPPESSFDTFTAKQVPSSGHDENVIRAFAPTTQKQIGIPSIYVSEQKAGNVIEIDSASLTYPGFIVIQKATLGKPGEIIGVSTFVPEGETSSVHIPLTLITTTKQAFYATIYTDNGDRLFTLHDLPTDPLVSFLFRIQ